MNYLTPTSSDPIARVRALGPAIGAAAEEIERTQCIPEPLLSQMHEARVCRMLLPRSVDGDELEPWIYLRALEEISRHDGSVGWNVFVANSSALIAPFLPPESARAIFADPRAVVAWGPPNASQARAVPGGYRVSGQWQFASGCRQATWMGAHCRVQEPDGSLRTNAAGRPIVRTLLVPVGKASLIDGSWQVIGMRGTMSGAYRLDDVFVPEAFSGTREDPALRREPGRLADNAVVQANVAQREARIGAARAYLTDTLATIWSADDSWVIDVPARARVRLACCFAIQAAEAVAHYTYKAAGTDAIFLGTPFERRFRDMHTLSQQMQSRAAHFESVGQVLLGIEPPGPFF
jgi:alkylation response protein AidB-like acyl-CoA dehydrogenase